MDVDTTWVPTGVTKTLHSRHFEVNDGPEMRDGARGPFVVAHVEVIFSWDVDSEGHYGWRFYCVVMQERIGSDRIVWTIEGPDPEWLAALIADARRDVEASLTVFGARDMADIRTQIQAAGHDTGHGPTGASYEETAI